MNKPEIALCFWNSTRYDTDSQDEAIEHVYTDHFDQKAMNLLGIETVGTHTDAEQAWELRFIDKNPTKAPFHVQPENYIRAYTASMAHMFQSRGPDAFLLRQMYLMQKWNIDNPGTIIYPFHESYPDKKSRDDVAQVVARGSTLDIDLADPDIEWKAMAQAGRRKFEAAARAVRMRMQNWIRKIDTAPEIIEEISKRRGLNKVKILLTLNPLYQDIGKEIESRLGDGFELEHETFIGASIDDHLVGEQAAILRILRGENVTDEEILRAQFFEGLLAKQSRAGEQNYTDFNVYKTGAVKALWDSVCKMSIEEICEYEDSIEGSNLLKTQTNNENNLWLGRNFAFHFASRLLEFTGDEGLEYALFKSAFEKLATPFYVNQSRPQIVEIYENERLDVTAVNTILRSIGAQHPRKTDLWRHKTKKEVKAGEKLVKRIQHYFNRDQIRALYVSPDA
ncbi:hypothetical protein GF340_05610 [Candidatus Peregrinibacteria bacterium]|nr:hypothetical protein [Candidatus Peregrinibacteria bacterium]